MEKNNELLDKVLSLQADNKIAFMTIDGLQGGPIEDFVKQPIEGQLYDVNRDRATLYSMANENKNKRWINDLALVYMYEYANETIEEQRRHITNLECELDLTRKEIEKLKHHIVEITEKNEQPISTKVEEQPVNKTNDVNTLTSNKHQSIFQPVMGTISI
jgi:predicted RNase H-like nuclease (RuvC/YqgF family)